MAIEKDGFVLSDDLKTLLTLKNTINPKELIIPEGIEIIDQNAISRKQMEILTFPSTLKIIKESNFFECNNLKKINFPKDLKVIEPKNFLYCNNIETVLLPKGLEKIHESFNHCYSLQSVYIPSKVNSIQTSFCDCINLKDIFVSKENPIYTDCDINIIYDNLNKILVRGNTNGIIPEGTKIIGKRASNSLIIDKIIRLPKSLEEIDNGAFYTASTNGIVFNNNLKHIDDLAFKGCENNISELKLPNSLEYIGIGAFRNWDNLETLHIPYNSDVERRAFAGCSNLKTIYFNCDIYDKSYEIFDNCYKLENIYVRKIDKSSDFYKKYKNIIQVKSLSIDDLISEGMSMREINKILRDNNAER